MHDGEADPPRPPGPAATSSSSRWVTIALRPFYLWLSHRPSILVFLAIPIAIGWGALGAGAGIPLLLHSDRWVEQLESGFAVGLCLTHLSYVGWLVLRGAQPTGRPGIPRDDHARGTLPVLAVLFGAGTLVADWHVRTAVLVASCVLAMALGSAAWRSALARRAEHAAVARLEAMAIRTGAPWRVALRVRVRVRHLLGIDETTDHRPIDAGDDAIVLLHGIALLTGWGILVVLYLVMGRPVVTAATSMCLLLAIVAMIWGYLRFWSRRTNLMLLLAAIAAASMQAMMFGRCDTLESLEGRPPVPLARCLEKPVGLLEDDATLAAWRAAAGTPPPVLVVIATSGGGVRAAGWTIVVLERLERELEDFAARTRLVTGASGGMLGAALWVATLGERDADRFARVTQDALGPLFAHAALMVVGSRGAALERAWERNAPALARRFSDLRATEAEGRRPSLVFAPVIVEEGRRLLASHLDLGALVHAWTDVVALGQPSRSACQWGSLFPDADPRISELARTSASFPYVTPPVLLPTDPWIRVADAGYYDNYGVNLAARWIEVHAPWLRANTRGVVLIQIRDRATDWDATRVEEPGVFARALSPLLAPLQTVLAVRSAAALFRNDEALASLDRRMGGDGFFTAVTFAMAGDVSLSWRLTDEERDAIRCNLADDPTLECGANRTNAASLARLRTWWTTRGEP